jgi:hypothetical protein
MRQEIWNLSAVIASCMLPMPAIMNCTYKIHEVSLLNTTTTQLGWRGIAPFTLDRGKWLTSCLTTLHPGKNPSTHRIGNWVGPRAGLDIWDKRYISCTYWDLNPNPSSLQPRHYTDYTTTAPHILYTENTNGYTPKIKDTPKNHFPHNYKICIILQTQW